MDNKETGQSENAKIVKKIGATTYEVTVNFSKTSCENMSDKIIRLIKNDIESSKPPK